MREERMSLYFSIINQLQNVRKGILIRHIFSCFSSPIIWKIFSKMSCAKKREKKKKKKKVFCKKFQIHNNKIIINKKTRYLAMFYTCYY